MRLKLTQVLIVPTSRLSVDPSPNYLKKVGNNDYGQKRRRVFVQNSALHIGTLVLQIIEWCIVMQVFTILLFGKLLLHRHYETQIHFNLHAFVFFYCLH